MSAATGGFSQTADESSDLGFREALIIGGGLIALLVGLVIIKFVFFAGLDLFCEVDGGILRRKLTDELRKIFPFGHVRTAASQTTASAEEPTRQREVETVVSSASSVENGPVDPELEKLMAKLPQRILKAEDLPAARSSHDEENPLQSTTEEELNDEDDASSSSIPPFPCSICLQGLEVGQTVYESTTCGHIFHLQCLAQWALSSSSNHGSTVSFRRPATARLECPNCRAQLPQQDWLVCMNVSTASS